MECISEHRPRRGINSPVWKCLCSVYAYGKKRLSNLKLIKGFSCANGCVMVPGSTMYTFLLSFAHNMEGPNVS